MTKFPNHWVIKDLESCVEILDNKRIPVNSDERAKRQGEVPYYGATGQAGWIDDYIFDEELVLVGEDGAPFFEKEKNVAFIIKGKSWVNNHAHVLKALNGVTVNQFLLHYLNYFDYKDYVGGTTRLKLNQGSLKKIPFPLPPLPEQKRIVAKLDTLFGHLDQLKARLQNIPILLKQFRQAVLTQAVTGKLTDGWRRHNSRKEWKQMKLGQLISKIEAGKNFSCPEISVTKGTVGLVKISAVTWDKFNPLETKTVTDKEKIERKYFIEKGDFLISRANTIELVGASVIVDDIDFDIMISDKVWRVQFENETTKHFVHRFLKSDIGRREIEGRATGNQLSMRNLSQDKFKDIDIEVPPVEEQKEIIRRIELVLAVADRIETSYKTLQNKIDQLPQAILNKAFRGELVKVEREVLEDSEVFRNVPAFYP